MQLLPTIAKDIKTVEREASVGAHLPYIRHIDDHTIETEDGYLMQTICIRGLLFETADSDELNYRNELRDRVLRAVGSSNYALYHQVIRRRVEPDLDADFPDDFSKDLDAKWRARMEARQLYVNDLFLTLVRRPLQGRAGTFDRIRAFFSKSARAESSAASNDLRQLNAARDALMAALGSYEPRLLSVYEVDGSPRSEPLEFLSCILNGDMRPVGLPHGEISHYLGERRISFGQQAIELGPSSIAPRQFAAVISIKDYPSATIPGMFDELYRLPIEMTISQSFAFVEQQETLKQMNLSIRRMRSAEDEAVSLREELLFAKDEVAAGRAAFGEHHTTIALRADSLEKLDSAVAEITALLADLGMIAVREEIGLEPAFWAQFPGNFKFITRKGLVSTRNFAGLASLHNFPVGQANGNHWGNAVSLLETTAAGPYFFNFHQADLGNFTVIGPSGSGKTVVLNFLLAQARRFNPRIIFFDKDRGAELFIRAIGGNYDRLRAGEPSGLNPLQLEETPENRQFLIDWIAQLAGNVDTDELGHIKEAVDANFASPRESRRLAHLTELFRGYARPRSDDLFARLRPWWGDGERAWLFDNAEDQTDLSASAVGFDMTAILDDPVVRTPALMYFFHRVEERLDGEPSIIVVDEGWKALDDDVFVRRIKDWEKTIRKRNGIVGFATQSAQDALESQIASAIIEQAATQIFMANPRGRYEDYVDGFGLSDHEYELIKSLPDSAHCFLIRHGNDSVVARLDLSGEKDMLTILSGRERTVRIFDELMAEEAHSETNWLPRLLELV